MADTITVKDENTGQFAPHPAGTFVGRCVDVIDLGEKVERFGDFPEKLVHKVALVFRTGVENEATGDPIDVSAEFTASFGEKAAIRKFLQNWRGKPYSEDEAKQGAPLHKLVGVGAQLSVVHKVSGAGRTYAKIDAVQPVHPKLKSEIPDGEGYQRADYWGQRKEEYAAAAAKFRAEHEPRTTRTVTEVLADEPDDLPF